MENCSQIKDRQNDRKACRQTSQAENDDNDSEGFQSFDLWTLLYQEAWTILYQEAWTEKMHNLKNVEILMLRH